jgi:hypothetical protein
LLTVFVAQMAVDFHDEQGTIIVDQSTPYLGKVVQNLASTGSKEVSQVTVGNQIHHLA